uniref:AlNc14C10G1250 protein n=1 Tax=Albugo laibachii Nc14 TaxID=890382 RepID=F0W2K3_9STRA|nr:AlNc14C10G1250 [Albugo laibachii Nc14]|eukprot:CCA15289.1 AlNc14C10G1250 [Albugo laibachii Nc14]
MSHRHATNKRLPSIYSIVSNSKGRYIMSAHERRDEGTTTVTQVSTEQDEPTQAYNLRLYPRVRVRFDESVIDNEHLGRKKSKKCCIFHKKKDFNESSSESEDENSDTDTNESKEHHHHKSSPQTSQCNNATKK